MDGNTGDAGDEDALVLEYKVSKVEVPSYINKHLRPYQREGVQFLYSHYRQNTGALLADDMGLGKTIQAIAFIAAILHKRDASRGRDTPPFLQSGPECAPPPAEQSGAEAASSGRPPPVLIVCPAAVLFNWVAEFNTWGRFDIGLFVVNKRSDTMRAARNRTLDVVLTSFEAARAHVTTLNGVDWSAVVVDEVHRLKSATSLVTRALSGLACRRRYGLSGTVLQNDLRELWCLLDWANPGCLGTCDQFVEDFVRPIELGRRRGAVKREVAASWQKRELLATLRQRWVLRRTKAAIADQLPNKTDQVVYCPLSQFQRDVYRSVLACRDVQLILRRARPCDCGSARTAARCCLKGDQESVAAASRVLSYISLLLKVSNHPYLLTPRAGSSKQQSVLARQVCRSVFSRCTEFASLSRINAFNALSDPKYCGKMQVLITLMERFRSKSQKVLIFSFSTRMLKIIRAYVSNQGYPLTYIDGDTPAAERPSLCAQFSQQPRWGVALVSTRAGGQGLNIVGATGVVVFDPSWNPAHDLQAQDRAYRLGQTRDVSVYRLISAGTIEEDVYLRQVYKQQLSTLAVEDGTAPRLFAAHAGCHAGELFGIVNLLQLRQDGQLTEGLLRRHRQLEESLTRAVGRPVVAALQAVRTGVAGLTVSDYAAVAPSCGEQVLPPGGEDEELAAEDDHPAAASSVEVALKSCGVSHMHRNTTLVTTSRIEEHVARQAVRAVFELGTGTQDPADQCTPLTRQAEPSGEMVPSGIRHLPPVRTADSVLRSPGGAPTPTPTRTPTPVPVHRRPRPSPAAAGGVRRRTGTAADAAAPSPAARVASPARRRQHRAGRRKPELAFVGIAAACRAARAAATSGRAARDVGEGSAVDMAPGCADAAPPAAAHPVSAGPPVEAGREVSDASTQVDDTASRMEGVLSRTENATSRTEDALSRARSVTSMTGSVPSRVQDILSQTESALSQTRKTLSRTAGDLFQSRDPISQTETALSRAAGRPATAAAADVSTCGAAHTGASSPKRARPSPGSAKALLDRMLESPGRRPPPTRRRAAARADADPLSRWLRDGKLSIVE